MAQAGTNCRDCRRRLGIAARYTHNTGLGTMGDEGPLLAAASILDLLHTKALTVHRRSSEIESGSEVCLQGHSPGNLGCDKKTFVTYADHHHDDRLAFWCAAPEGIQAAMVAAAPYLPPYVGHRGWLGVYLDVPVDWDEIADIVENAYRLIAPKRLVAGLDASSGS